MSLASAPPRGPRLLFVVNAAWFFRSHRLAVARGARAAGYEVHLAAPENSGTDELEDEGISVHSLPLARGHARLGDDLRTLRVLYSLYRRLRPDIVHHVTLKPALFGSFAARVARVPLTVNAVSGLGTLHLAQGRRARLRRSIVLAALRFGSRHPRCWHIFQNPDDEAVYLRAGIAVPERCIRIPGSGVDLDAFRPVAESAPPPIAVLPARLLGDKGVREFVAAARSLRASGLVARFALVGGLDPDNATAVSRQEIEAWVATGDVEWWGHQRNMAGVYAQAHVVCLPSYREGMSKALLEAAAAGRPMVTTDVPGCREAVTHGIQGLLVPPRDAASLAVALQTLLADSDLRMEMGAAARRRAEAEFGEDRVVAATLDLYARGLRRCAS